MVRAAEWSVGQLTHGVAEQSETTGAQAERVLGPPQWTAHVQSAPALTLVDAGLWQSVLLKLRGGANVLELFDPVRARPQGTLRGIVSLGADAAAGASFVVLSGCPAGSTLLPGDWLQIGSGFSTSQLVSVVEPMSDANAVFNADFTLGLAGWNSSFNNGVPVEFVIARFPPYAWALNGAATLHLMESGPNTGVADNHYIDWWSDPIPVTPGVTYTASAYTGAHRCRVAVFAYFLDSTGTAIGATLGGGSVINNAEAFGGTTLDAYKRCWSSGAPPAGTVSARLTLRKYGTEPGEADSHMFVTRAQFEAAATPGPWAPGQAYAPGVSVRFEPPLRQGFSVGTLVTTEKCLGYYRMQGTVSSQYRAGRLKSSGFAVDLVETWR